MLFCCLCLNFETSCHKHSVVVSRHQQTPPLTTSDNCHKLPWSGGIVLITPSRSQHWQHAIKTDTGRKSQFLPAPYTPAFNNPVRGIILNTAMTFGMEKLKWFGYPMVKKFWRHLYSFWQNVWTRRTDGRTDICIASHGKDVQIPGVGMPAMPCTAVLLVSINHLMQNTRK